MDKIDKVAKAIRNAEYDFIVRRIPHCSDTRTTHFIYHHKTGNFVGNEDECDIEAERLVAQAAIEAYDAS